MTMREVSNFDISSRALSNGLKMKSPLADKPDDTSLMPQSHSRDKKQLNLSPQRPPLHKNEQVDKESLAVALEELENSRAPLTRVRDIISKGEPLASPSKKDEIISAIDVVLQLKQLIGTDDTAQAASQKLEDKETSSPLAIGSTKSSPTEQVQSTSAASRDMEESEDGYAITSASESGTSRPKPKNRSQRRRTLALYRGDNLLKNRESSSPQFFLASTPSDESYAPSNRSSHASTTPDVSEAQSNSPNVQARTDQVASSADKSHSTEAKERSDQQAVSRASNMAGDKTNNENDDTESQKSKLSNSTVAKATDIITKQDCDSEANTSSPPPRRQLRRSKRRKTMALHQGSLLLHKSTPSSLSSVTPTSEESLLPKSTDSTKSSRGRNSANKQSRSIVEVVRRVTKGTPLELEEGDDASGSVADQKQTKKRVVKPKRRSRRNSIMPGKFRKDDIIMEYKPLAHEKDVLKHDMPTKEGSSDLDTADTQKSNDEKKRKELHPATTSPITLASTNGDNRIVNTSINNDKLQNEETCIDHREIAVKVVDPCRGKTNIAKPTSDSNPGNNIVKNENDSKVLVESTDHPGTKKRRKRRSSIGLHVTGGLLTPKDIEHVMQESQSRKRSRRHERDTNGANSEKIIESEPNAIGDMAATEITEELSGLNNTAEVLAAGQTVCDEANDKVYGAELPDGRPTAPGSMTDAIEGDAQSDAPVVISQEANIMNGEGSAVDLEVSNDIVMQPSRNIDAKEPTMLSSVISAANISDRIRVLFPDENIMPLTCVSARIFACYTLVAEQSYADARNEKISNQMHMFRPAEPLLSLLRLMVRAEMTSLGATSTDINNEQPQFTGKKQVQFCGIDCSSTKPPVDAIAGSQMHLEADIRALVDVLQEVNKICKIDEENGPKNVTDEVKINFKTLVLFLRDLGNKESASGKVLREACAESMPHTWPPQRFVNAANLFHSDFELMFTSLNENQPCTGSGFLILENRLADFLGRAVRFYLRKFFNPIPAPLTTDQRIDDSSARSCIHEIVEMTVDGGTGRDTAAADGSISSVFSIALRRIYDEFGMENCLSDDFVPQSRNNFFSSAASQRGVGTKRATIVISDEDLREVQADINEAHLFLGAARACEFLGSLMTWPGVKEEIERVGGWENVETYGKMIAEFGLEYASPDDAYFVLLRDVDAFIIKVQKFWKALEPSVLSCEKEVGRLWKRFRCGTQSTSVLKRNPHIRSIAAALQEGKAEYPFPSLSEPSFEEE